MAEKTRREILAEAFDAAEDTETRPDREPKEESGGEDSGTVGSEGTGQDEQRETAGAGKEESGEEGVKKDEEKLGKKQPDKKEESVDAKERRAAAEAEQRQSTRTTDKPPNSWKPAVRESWGKIPADARAEINRREIEIQRELSQTATIRKFSADLAKVVSPHLPILQAQNTNPLDAINNLMTTAASLYSGNQEQKARIIAQIIQNYQVDIKTLDAVLSKSQLPPTSQQPNPNEIPRWAQPIFGFMNQAQQAKAQREHQLTEEANAEIESVREEWPFFDDLREDIADLMETAAKRGRAMTLKEGYERAVALDPEISKIINQRKIAAEQQKSTNLGNRQKAAKTISGAPKSNSGGKQKPETRRQVLEAAWDEMST